MDRQYVGFDFHRRRSVMVRMNGAGEKLSSVRVPNEPLAIAAAVAEAGPEPEVVIEATYGWYWIVNWLQEQGAVVHLANPSGLHWGTRRVKNDERDAVDLIDMLRLGRLPEAWIAPPATRELRELVRYRAPPSAPDRHPGRCGRDDAICPFELLTPVERTAYRFAGSDRAYVVPSPTHLAS